MIIAQLLKGFVKFFDNGNSNVAVTSNTIAPKRYKYAIKRNPPFRKDEWKKVLKAFT